MSPWPVCNPCHLGVRGLGLFKTLPNIFVTILWRAHAAWRTVGFSHVCQACQSRANLALARMRATQAAHGAGLVGSWATLQWSDGGLQGFSVQSRARPYTANLQLH